MTADTSNTAIRKVSATTGIVTTLAGPDKLHSMGTPYSLLVAPSRDIYFTTFTRSMHKLSTDTGDVSVISTGDSERRLTGLAYHPPSGKIQAVASREGTLSAKVYSFEPDLSAVTVAAQSVPAIYPRGIAFNSAGDTLIGAYFGSYSGVLQWAKSSALEAWIQVSSATTTADDGVAATTAKLSAFALAVDANGNMLVSDVELDSYFQAVRCAVWLVDAGTGKLKRVAGTLGPCGSTVDPNNPGNTKIGRSGGVAFDPSGNWAYIADPDNQRILKIDLKCGSK